MVDRKGQPYGDIVFITFPRKINHRRGDAHIVTHMCIGKKYVDITDKSYVGADNYIDTLT